MKPSDTYVLLRLPQDIRAKVAEYQREHFLVCGSTTTPGEVLLTLIEFAIRTLEG